ncbi:AbrB family transcriptional regulator [Microvirga aerophila]|uniref:AbrB family transcriptional regulator n=1 Tax=Microvirga aerophila TaxID=670291 RepID=UPI0011BF150D
MDAAYFSGMPGGLMVMVIACEDRDGDAQGISLFHSVRVLLVVLTLPKAASRRHRYPRDHPGWF